MNAHRPPDATPNTDEAIDFLRALDATGRHNLVAIDPQTGDVTGKTFEPGDWSSVAAWIEAHTGRRNLYASVNEPRPGAPDDKLTKADVGAIRALFADLDPAGKAPLDEERAEIARKVDALQHNAVPPSFTIDSGSGSQFVWKLDRKLDPAETRQWAEDQGRAIRQMIGGDAVQNIDRIMRLPGTLNIPTPKKVAKGRVERLATITHRTGATYAPETLSAAVAPVKAETTDTDERVARIMAELDMTAVRSQHAFDDLPEELRSRFRQACLDDRALGALWRGEAPAKDASGSGYRAALATKLARHGGFTAEDFGSLVWVWDFAVQDGDDREEKITRRAIARDWARMGEPHDVAAIWYDPDAAAAASARPDGGTGLFGEPEPQRRFAFTGLLEAADTALGASAAPLIKGLLDQGTMSILYGESNSGKTFVAMDIAYHIAAGRRWGGMRTEQMAVVYVAAEGGSGARKRAAALVARYGRDDVPFHLLLSPVNLLRADADLQPLVASIREIGVPVGLIVIDTLSRAMAGGDENASTDMGALVRHLDVLRAATRAHVLAVHHSGKDRAKGARGHSLLRAATDTEIEIADRVLSVTKQRDLDGSFSTGFALDVMTLGVDADGDPVTSCTVRLVRREAGEVVAPSVAEDRVLTALDACLAGAADESKGVPLAEIAMQMGGGADKMSVEKVRFHIRALIAKRQIVRCAHGRYGRNGQFVRSETEENGPSVSVPKRISVERTEENGGRNGGSVFL